MDTLRQNHTLYGRTYNYIAHIREYPHARTHFWAYGFSWAYFWSCYCFAQIVNFKVKFLFL